MSQKITDTRIDSLILKLRRVQTDIDKMRLGNVRAADGDRVFQLREARHEVDIVIGFLEKARPTKNRIGV